MNMNRILLMLLVAYSSAHAQGDLLEEILGKGYEQRRITEAEFEEKYAAFWQRGKEVAPNADGQEAIDALLAPLQQFLLQGLAQGRLKEYAAIAERTAVEVSAQHKSAQERAQQAAQRWRELIEVPS